MSNRPQEELIIHSGLSILNETIMATTMRIKRAVEETNLAAEKLDKEIASLNKSLIRVNNESSQKHNSIKEEVINLREDILLELLSAMKYLNCPSCCIKKIGSDGSILNEKVNIIISKHTQDLIEQQIELTHKIEKTLGISLGV